MLEVKDLVKKFGLKSAVDGVSFTISRGEVLVLLGPNGAGKTTIIRLLSALLRPSSGYAKIFGLDVVESAESIRRAVGVLTELPALYYRMNLLEYLEFFGRLYGVAKDSLRERVFELINLLNLDKEYLKNLESFSKGMKQKASLARALIHNPDVVFLDEPTSALDPESSKTVRDHILSLREDKKIILVCTHNLSEAEYLASRIAIIKDGKIIFIGGIKDLKEKVDRRERFLIKYNFKSEEDLRKSLNEFFKGEKDIKLISLDKNEILFETKNPEQNSRLLRFLLDYGVNVITCTMQDFSLEEAYLRFIPPLSEGTGFIGE